MSAMISLLVILLIVSPSHTLACHAAAGRETHDLGADALAREDLEEHGVAHAAVDDVGLLRTPAQRVDAALDLGDHPLADHAVADQLRGALDVERRNEAPSASWMPSTSVSRISFSARSASATLPATRSALML